MQTSQFHPILHSNTYIHIVYSPLSLNALSALSCIQVNNSPPNILYKMNHIMEMLTDSAVVTIGLLQLYGCNYQHIQVRTYIQSIP